MGIITITNDGNTDMNVANKLIAPGESRQFDESLVSTAPRPTDGMSVAPKEAAPDAGDALQTLLVQSVINIKAALPDLPDEDLVALYRLEEEADKPRSTLLGVIGEEQLLRASAQENTGNSEGETSG